MQKWVLDNHQAVNLSSDDAGNFAILHNLVLRSIILHLLHSLSNVIHREVCSNFGHRGTPLSLHFVINPTIYNVLPSEDHLTIDKGGVGGLATQNKDGWIVLDVLI